jgi:transcriptional regulator
MVMTVEEVEGSFKLNQHKSDADFAAIANALGEGDADARQISRLMRQTRPQIFADQVFEDGTNKLERSAS